MADVSDLVPTLAAVAATASTPTRIRGVGFIRDKESDRLGDLADGLATLGAQVEVLDDGLRIAPATLHGGVVATHHDHRLAMAYGVVGAVVPGVRVGDPDVVTQELARLLGRPRRRRRRQPRRRADGGRRLRRRRHVDDGRLRGAVPAPRRRDGGPGRRPRAARRARPRRRWPDAIATRSRRSRPAPCSPDVPSPRSRASVERSPPGSPPAACATTPSPGCAGTSARATRSSSCRPRSARTCGRWPSACPPVPRPSPCSPPSSRRGTDWPPASSWTATAAAPRSGAVSSAGSTTTCGGRHAVELWAYGDSPGDQ